MTAEAIAGVGVAVALLAVLVPLLLVIRADIRRLDDRLLLWDARLRNVEIGLAFLRGRLQPSVTNELDADGHSGDHTPP